MFNFRVLYSLLCCLCTALICSSCIGPLDPINLIVSPILSAHEQQRVDEFNRNNTILSFMSESEQICAVECEQYNMRKIEYITDRKSCGCAMK